MLLLAPSTETELKIGGLNITVLNSWFNMAQIIDSENIDSKGDRIENSENYFSYLSKVFEDYKLVILDAIKSNKFDDNIMKVEDEKMGDEWNAMVQSEEKNERVKRDSDTFFEENDRNENDRNYRNENNENNFQGDNGGDNYVQQYDENGMRLSVSLFVIFIFVFL